MTSLRGLLSNYYHFTDKNTEAYRNWTTCSWSQDRDFKSEEPRTQDIGKNKQLDWKKLNIWSGREHNNDYKGTENISKTKLHNNQINVN